MEEKRSSRMMMSEASMATCVPEMPMDRPTSAALSAGASLVPSPVTPTTALNTTPLLTLRAAAHSSR
jgi:hypothetical protein